MPNKPSQPTWHLLLALLLGALTILGFAPFFLFPVPVLLLAVLFLLWQRADGPLAAALSGWLYGLGYFGLGVSWVYVSLQEFGGMPVPVALFSTTLFVAFLALFPALVAYLLRRFFAGRAFWLAAPALWVAVEWLRGWIFTGFPWLALGYSQVPSSPLAGYAPLLGVYGISLLLALSATLLLRRSLPAVAAVMVVWLCGWSLQQISWTEPVGEPVPVSLTQGNIEQSLKWDAQRLYRSLDSYAELVRQSQGRLIVLPETALPMFYQDVPQDYLAFLAYTARSRGGDVLVGLPESTGGGHYYNSVISLGSAPVQVYRKVHLVPFGEYVALPWLFQPLLQFLHIPMSDFSRGALNQQPLQVAGQQVAVNICYEDVFGEEIIGQLPAATLLVNVSNDAWFGDSFAPEQHLQIAQMRALETGRYLLRSTNTGVTAIIDQRGRVRERLPSFVAAVLNGSAQGYSGATLYVRWGNAVVLGGILIMLLLAVRLR